VTFIENGVARAVAYDSYTAAKEDKQSTGHATPAYFNAGPFPTNLFMTAGNSDLDEMISSTEEGILVTRFHYTNIVEPMTTVITGMTRDGTFLIEGGKVTRPIRNLRFTQSILEAFKNIEMISRTRERIAGEGATYVVPALKIRNFRFTGKTQ
jgi:predicted Zn-dependent protease